MANVITWCLLFILSNSLLTNFVIGKSNGFSIRIIHPDSPESPFYQPNRPFIEKFARFVKQSKASHKYYSTLKQTKPSDIGAKIDLEGNNVFVANLGIGSFLSVRQPFKAYYFQIDPGSDITWIECKDCKHPGNHCLRPHGEPFPDDTSKTYEKLKCNPAQGQRHPLCNPRDCIGEFCGYNIEYEDSSTSKGFLSEETFTFDSTIGTRRKERVSDLVFGCATDIKNMNYANGSKVAGILGLGWGARSFVNQLRSKSNGKFSYCLQTKAHSNVSTFLQFGDHIPTSQAIYRTPLLKVQNEYAYFVDLIGITAAGTLLNLTQHDFSRKPNHKGGCVIDSGTSSTLLPAFAYQKLKQRLMAYFSTIHDLVHVMIKEDELCYRRIGAKQGYRNLPKIIFHFKGVANLQLEPESIYTIYELEGEEFFCLEMGLNEKEDQLTLIGAYQQTNHRFIFDTREKMLRFGPENCARSALDFMMF